MLTRVTAVIPYFQRKPGLLRHAVESALNQRGVADLTVLVVDDSSPVPARAELEDLLLRYPRRMQLVEQPNGGPGKARNTALDLVAQGTEYVAFLDSDDTWTETHIANAVSALDKGYDLYFADFIRWDWDSSALSRCKKFNAADHLRIPHDPPLYEFRGGDMVRQLLIGNVLGTSSVVYRYAEFPTLRYRTDLRNSGEDIVFWFDLASRTRRIVFSTECESNCGAGVNICYGARWGEESFVNVAHDDVSAWRYIAKNFELRPDSLRLLKRNISKGRRDLTAGLLYEASRKRRARAELLVRHLKRDPAYALLLLPLTVRVLFDWMLERFRRGGELQANR